MTISLSFIEFGTRKPEMESKLQYLVGFVALGKIFILCALVFSFEIRLIIKCIIIIFKFIYEK